MTLRQLLIQAFRELEMSEDEIQARLDNADAQFMATLGHKPDVDREMPMTAEQQREFIDQLKQRGALMMAIPELNEAVIGHIKTKLIQRN